MTLLVNYKESALILEESPIQQKYKQGTEGNLYQVGCSSVCLYKRLAMLSSSHRWQSTFFVYNVISHWLSEKNSKNFAIMKKYFVLFTLLLIAVVSNAQESITDSLGCYESSSVKFCSYKEAYLKNDMAGVVRLDEFEVSYDKLGKAYTVYVRFDSSIVNAEVKYVRGSVSEGYLYDGVVKNSRDQEKVTVFCKNKLSLYTQNHGVASKSIIKDYEKEGINLIFPKTYIISSVVPIKN